MSDHTHTVHSKHHVPFVQDNRLERTYELPFAVYHDGGLTRTGAWLLNELSNNDAVHAEAVDDTHLHVNMPASELACTSAPTRDRAFAGVDHTIEAACQKDDDHRALKDKYIDLL
jgi:hypothetical protein